MGSLDGGCRVGDKVPETAGLLWPNTCQALKESDSQMNVVQLSTKTHSTAHEQAEVRLLVVGAESGEGCETSDGGYICLLLACLLSSSSLRRPHCGVVKTCGFL
jgi:hypothetical protein